MMQMLEIGQTTNAVNNAKMGLTTPHRTNLKIILSIGKIDLHVPLLPHNSQSNNMTKPRCVSKLKIGYQTGVRMPRTIDETETNIHRAG